MDSILGEFSREKIRKLIEEIDIKNIENKEKQQKIINIIAEPVVKRKIQEKFNNTYSNSLNASEYKFIKNAIHMGYNDSQISELMDIEEGNIIKLRKIFIL